MLQPFGKSVVSSPEVVDLLKKQMVSGGSTPLFSKAPMFLKQALLFPYDAGFDFERALLTAGGKTQAYRGVLGNPPVDTAQILEPRTYLDQQQHSMPRLPNLTSVIGKDYEKFDDGGFGEFDLQILVKQWMPTSDPSQPQSDVAAAAAASKGAVDKDLQLIRAWRGGYYLSFRKKSDAKAPINIVFLMRLATPQDARKFETVYRSGLKQRYKSLRMKSPSVIETEEGPITLSSDGEWFTATEGFDVTLSQKIRDAMLSDAKQGSASAAKAATVN